MRALVTAGSSGGHIFPALSFIEGLKKEYPGTSALLVLPANAAVKKDALAGFDIKYISVSSAWGLLKSFFQGAFLIAEFRPDIAVGFGSISSLPVMLCAWLFRIPTMIHEQNVIPGKANVLLAWFCDSVAVSFEQTRSYLKQKGKIILTGNPVRQKLEVVDKQKALKFFGLQDKTTILVMGGSQGSSRINAEFLKAAGSIRGDLQVIHLCGPRDPDMLKSGYDKLGIEARVFSFLDQMHYAYSASDLLIARAGAITISEAAFFGIPAILIPYPFAGAHQAANARVLTSRGCAIEIEDPKLTPGLLKDKIEGLMGNAKRLEEMRLAYKSLQGRDPAAALAAQAKRLISS